MEHEEPLRERFHIAPASKKDRWEGYGKPAQSGSVTKALKAARAAASHFGGQPVNMYQHHPDIDRLFESGTKEAGGASAGQRSRSPSPPRARPADTSTIGAEPSKAYLSTWKSR